MPNNPVVASYVATFLKMEQYHVYWQLVGLKPSFDAHVFTHKRENVERFPYMEKWLHVLKKPSTRWLRRLIHKQIRQEPWQIYRSEMRDLLLLLARIDAQVLHIYFGHVAPHFIPLLKVWKHPTVVSFHGADAAVDMDKPRYRAAMQEVFRLVTKVQSRSEALAADLVELGCPEEKIVIQRTCIPLQTWPYVERTAPANGAWHLVQSCRFIEKKGLDLTLRAFAAVHKKFPNSKLSLIGDGPLRAALEQEARALGIFERVHFTGFLKYAEMKPIIDSAHIFMQPSRTGKDGNREGIPNAMLEAMATGIAVVASRHGGIPEAVTHRVDGLLVPENDGEALIVATLSLIDEPGLAVQLGKEASAMVARIFGREIQSERLAAFYRDLIASHNG